MPASHSCFNPRPCARGDSRSAEPAADLQFQSTPLREGRPRCKTGLCRRDRVSIHAPARGATDPAVHERIATDGFNPRPCARGDVGVSRRLERTTGSFNPRPCARGDRRAARDDLRRRCVSIHAPARGATQRPSGRSSIGDVSIHAPARGATAAMRSGSPARRFQSTPLREGRHVRSSTRPRLPTFQSTPLREGRRGLCADIARFDAVSIHAPARGATSCSSG